MIQKAASTSYAEEAEDGYSPIMIDYEAPGWCPSYWEFANAMFSCGRLDDDQSVLVLKRLSPSFDEYS
jgi:hypothetical protein